MTIQSLLDKPLELLNFINERLKPKDIEKKKYGEVFTPIPLIEEMLDKLPIEVWTNPNLKWFDPANGMGNFMIAIYFRLMKGLKDIISDEEQRKKHILENMLYMSEINKKNCFLTKQIFDINNNYKLNIYNGDSLTLDTFKVWNVEKFDIIVGNPPYQDSSGNKGKGHTLWDRFVRQSLNTYLKNNGFLLFIHPSSWRQINNELFELMKTKQIIYLEIHNEKDGMKTFSCATRYDFYLLRNCYCETLTKIKGEDNIIVNINLKEWNFIPNMMFNEIQNICNETQKLDVMNYRSNYGADKKHVSNIKNNEFKYPVIYSIDKSNEPNLRWSNTNDNGHFGLSKFIFSNGSGFILDNNGIYGLTQWAYCIYDEPIFFNKILKCFHNNKFKKIIKAIQLDSSTYNIKVMKLFNKNFYEKFQEDNEIENDNTSILSKSTSKSTRSTKLSTDEVILCGAPLKKKGEICKNKANPQCNGKCKKHFVLVV